MADIATREQVKAFLPHDKGEAFYSTQEQPNGTLRLNRQLPDGTVERLNTADYNPHSILDHRNAVQAIVADLDTGWSPALAINAADAIDLTPGVTGAQIQQTLQTVKMNIGEHIRSIGQSLS